MRKFTLFLAIAAVTASAAGLSPRDRMALRHAQLRAEGSPISQVRSRAAAHPGSAAVPSGTAPAAPSGTVMAMAQLRPGMTADGLAETGATVLGERHGFVFLELTPDVAEAVATHPSLKSFEISRPVSAKLDEARAITGVDLVHQGYELTQPYTGKGVVCGIVDGGFDPSHAAFRNEDGTSRISTMSNITVSSSTGRLNIVYYDPETVLDLATDDYQNYHGSHTLGIMAGGYRGDASVATVTSAVHATSSNVTKANPYYGPAYEADLAVGAGASYDAQIAYNIDNILNYADYAQAPCVINISLGVNQGPHDGSSELCQYFDACAENDNAIFCLAAGNEGSWKLALNKTFNEQDSTISTFIDPYLLAGSDYENLRYGQIEIYSDTEQDFTITLVAYNRSRQRIAWQKTLSTNSAGQAYYFASSDDYIFDSDYDYVDPQFARYFTGCIGYGTTVDETSGRYYGVIDVYASDNTEYHNENYLLGFIVTGHDGQRVDIYGDAQYLAFSSYDEPGWDDGMTDGSVSDMACGQKTICCGSFNSRETWPAMDGGVYTYGIHKLGDVTYFSSYGTLMDGTTRPHVLAPGCTVVSCTNNSYQDAITDGWADYNFCARADAYDRKSYYVQMNGTSMSTPFLAGTIALWLQADPTLTVDDVKEVLKHTSDWDTYMDAAPAAMVGYGKLNAYNGIKKVLGLGGVSDVKVDADTKLFVAVDNATAKASLYGAKAMEAKLLNVAGTQVAAAKAAGDEVELSLSGLTPGVYILNVNNIHSQKILVK